MMPRLWTLAFLWGCWNSAEAQQQVLPITQGHVDSVYSQILGEKRAIWIYVPRQESNPAMAPKKFPVIYLLDGDNHFGFVTSLVRQLSEGFTHFLPEMIIVGIPNTDRLRDLTPTHITRTDTYTDSNLFRTTGGGPQFLSFLETELFRYVDSIYPTFPHRTFIGHSLGGLMVIEAMLKRQQMFNAWISIDPSLWYDNRKLTRDSEKFLAVKSMQQESLYLAIANNLKPGMDTLRMRSDTTASTGDTRAIFDFAGLLRSHPETGLDWQYRYYIEDDHGSVPMIAEYDGLRFVFRDYRLPDFGYLTDSTARPDLILKKQFDKLSQSWGVPVHAPEAFVNALGYTLLQKKQSEKALAVFQMNTLNYPGSANAFDSLGDCFLSLGNKGQAASAYRKSLEIRESAQTRSKLEKLIAGK